MENLKTNKLHFLLGEWHGNGKGQFPTINSFEYTEILTFKMDGTNDLIHYEQRTWLKPNQTPSHWESGFIKPVEGKENVFEISNAQDSGRVEVLIGELVTEDGKHILHFKMKLLQNDPRVISSERIFTISNQNLSYIKKMATQNTPDHQQHLEAELFKIV
ncbi:MAG: FABP family protein [Sphingobacteriaceae bacterium]